MECPNCGRTLSAYSSRCGSCGKAVPPAQHLLEESGIIEPSAPASAAAPARGPRPSCRTASLGDRMVAAALDGVVLFGVFGLVTAWGVMRWGFVSADGLELTVGSLLFAGLANTAILFLYLWLMEAGFTATLGTAMVGLRVVQTGRHGPFSACAIRNALRAVDGIGFYLVGVMVAACSRLRQRLGDIAAGTVVVEERFPAGVKLTAVLVWTAALAAAAWAMPRVCAGQLPIQPPPYFGRSIVQLGYTADSAHLRVSRLRLDLRLAPDSSTTADSSLH